MTALPRSAASHLVRLFFSLLVRSCFPRKSLKQVSKSKCPLIEHVRRRSLVRVRDVVEADGFSPDCSAPPSPAPGRVDVRIDFLRRENVQQNERTSVRRTCVNGQDLHERIDVENAALIRRSFGHFEVLNAITNDLQFFAQAVQLLDEQRVLLQAESRSAVSHVGDLRSSLAFDWLS